MRGRWFTVAVVVAMLVLSRGRGLHRVGHEDPLRRRHVPHLRPGGAVGVCDRRSDRAAPAAGQPHRVFDDRDRVCVDRLGADRLAQRPGVHLRTGAEQLLAGASGAPAAVVPERLPRSALALARDRDLHRHRGDHAADRCRSPSRGWTAAAPLRTPRATSCWCRTGRGSCPPSRRSPVVVAIPIVIAVLVIVWNRWRSATDATRRVLAPMYSTGAFADRGAAAVRHPGLLDHVLRVCGRLHRHPDRLSAGDPENAAGPLQRGCHPGRHDGRPDRDRRPARRVARGAERPVARPRLPARRHGRVPRRQRGAVRAPGADRRARGDHHRTRRRGGGGAGARPVPAGRPRPDPRRRSGRRARDRERAAAGRAARPIPGGERVGAAAPRRARKRAADRRQHRSGGAHHLRQPVLRRPHRLDAGRSWSGSCGWSASRPAIPTSSTAS